MALLPIPAVNGGGAVADVAIRDSAGAKHHETLIKHYETLVKHYETHIKHCQTP